MGETELLYGKDYARVQSREIPKDYNILLDSEWMDIKEGERVLELGSGSGSFLSRLKEKTNSSFGADVNWDAIRLDENNKNNAVTAYGEKLPFGDDSFDKSVSLHTLEHIENLGKVFSELDRVTKPGGVSVHVFPATKSRWQGSMVEAWQLKKGLIDKFKLAFDLHPHALDPKKLKVFIEGTDWEIEKAEKLLVKEELGWAYIVKMIKSV